MGDKLCWTGLGLIVALVPFLNALNISTSDAVIETVGAIIFIIGLIFKWANK